MRRLFLWSMIISLTLAALLGIGALILPRYGPNERVLGSTALFGAFSVIALMCATVLERRRLVPLMWAGLAAALGAMGFWLTLLWLDRTMTWEVEQSIIRAGGTLTVLAILCPHVGLLALPRFDHRAASGMRWAAVVVAGVLAVVIVDLIWEGFLERNVEDDLLFRGVGVLSILVACGTAVTPILWKVQAVKRATSAESIPLRVKVEIVCPRCRARQELNVGPGRRCAECGLRIGIDVEEPRCSCGYLLHRLESDTCPECGRAIRELDRWASSPQSLSSSVP